MIDAVCKGWAINHDFAALAVAWRVSFAPSSFASDDGGDRVILQAFGQARNSHVDGDGECDKISPALEPLARIDDAFVMPSSQKGSLAKTFPCLW